MPQKINPDVLELIRGKTARVVGNLQTLLVLIKGLPLAYNRDLQEDKPPLFDSVDTVAACLELADPLVAGAELNVDEISRGLDRGYLDATTLMEFMIKNGVPQRTAHHLVGQVGGRARLSGTCPWRNSIARCSWMRTPCWTNGFTASWASRTRSRHFKVMVPRRRPKCNDRSSTGASG